MCEKHNHPSRASGLTVWENSRNRTWKTHQHLKRCWCAAEYWYNWGVIDTTPMSGKEKLDKLRKRVWIQEKDETDNEHKNVDRLATGYAYCISSILERQVTNVWERSAIKKKQRRCIKEGKNWIECLGAGSLRVHEWLHNCQQIV